MARSSCGTLDYALFDQLKLFNYIHVPVIVASFLIVIGFLTVGGLQKQRREFFACMFVIVLVVGNAFTLGALSGPDDRYQSYPSLDPLDLMLPSDRRPPLGMHNVEGCA